MKILLRLLMLFSFIAIVMAVILLLNFTAPNPTGRRYASEPTLRTGEGDTQAIGLSAELVLAHDLGLTRNDEPDQRQCVCNSTTASGDNFTPAECRVCFAYTPINAAHRRPDFISAQFIAESKNVRDLLYSRQDRADQISDYAAAARSLKIPLWLYVRVDSNLSPDFQKIISSTGGGIVYYFTYPGYVDQVDLGAQIVLLIAVITFLGSAVLLVVLSGRRPKWIVVTPRTSPAPRRPVADPITKTKRKTDAAEDFLNRSKDRAQRDADTYDLDEIDL